MPSVAPGLNPGPSVDSKYGLAAGLQKVLLRLILRWGFCLDGHRNHCWFQGDLMASPGSTESRLSVEGEGGNSPPSADSSSCLSDKGLVLAGIPVRGKNLMSAILDTSITEYGHFLSKP